MPWVPIPICRQTKAPEQITQTRDVKISARPHIGILYVLVMNEPQEHFGAGWSVCVQPFAWRLTHPPFAARMRWLGPFSELDIQIKLGGNRAIITRQDTDGHNGRLLAKSKSLYVDNHIIFNHCGAFLKYIERGDYKS